MASYIIAVIEWGSVPLILLGLLLFTLFGIPDDKAGPEIRVSTRSGKWAGLIVLVLFIISQKNRELTFSFKIPAYGFAIWPTILSTAVGFVLSRFFDFIKRTRVIGIFVLLLVATTSITFYGYIFITNIRSTVVFVALGIAFGVLLHEVLFPESGSEKMKNINDKKNKT